MREKYILTCLLLARAIKRVPTKDEWTETKAYIKSEYGFDDPQDAVEDALASQLWFKCPMCGEYCLLSNGIFENPDDYATAGPFCCDDCVTEYRDQMKFDQRFELGTY